MSSKGVSLVNFTVWMMTDSAVFNWLITTGPREMNVFIRYSHYQFNGRLQGVTGRPPRPTLEQECVRYNLHSTPLQ